MQINNNNNNVKVELRKFLNDKCNECDTCAINMHFKHDKLLNLILADIVSLGEGV